MEQNISVKEKLCDIILLSYENPKLLKECVSSIMECTRVPSNLIIIDNASTSEEVKKYLMDLKGNDRMAVEKVFSEINAGFAGGMNKGLRLSTSKYVCLMNNDCIVTHGWLEEMIKVAEKDKRIGLVNPQSNTFGSVPDASVSLNEHAALLCDRSGRYVELGHAVAFACLVKREVLLEIGLLDEAFKGVCYEDTDFSVRAHQAGYISVMSERAYVFHYEQASRRKLEGKEEIYASNKKIFEDKWGKLLRILYLDKVSDGVEEKEAELYDDMNKIARQRCLLDLWIVRRPLHYFYPAKWKRAFAKHADVRVKFRGAAFISLKVIWKTLTKKKKYDAIVLPPGWLIGMMRFLSVFTKALVFERKNDGHIYLDKTKKFSIKDAGMITDFLRSKSR